MGRLAEPSLLLALIPESRRLHYAESRRERILGRAKDLFPPKDSSRRPPPRLTPSHVDKGPPRLTPSHGDKGGWDMSTAVASHPGEHLTDLCGLAGVTLKRREGGGEASVAVDFEALVAFARLWGCPHGKKEDLGGAPCGECAGRSDMQVLCGGSGGGSPVFFSILCRLVYMESAFHLVSLVEVIAKSGCGESAYEAAGRLLPLTIEQGLLVGEREDGEERGREEHETRIRAVCGVLQGQGRALEAIRLLAEAGLWDDVKEAAGAVPMNGGRRGAVLGAVLEGMEGWGKRRAKTGDDRGRGTALEALAAISDVWLKAPS